MFFFQMAVSFQDNSPIPVEKLSTGRLEVRATANMKSGGQRRIEFMDVKMSSEHLGVWKIDVDLRTELG